MDAAELARHRAAMERLGRIPGVVRVGYGLKQTAGRIVLGEPAYRVYVQRKRPLDEIPSDERIPPEIDGIKTDVLYADTKKPHTKTPSIAPGDTITRLIPNDFQSSGTLGLIVRRGSDRFILTNAHVLDDGSNLFDGARDIYDPHMKTCAGIHCNNPIAQIIDNSGVRGTRPESDGKTYYVDCTLATVNAGVDGANNLPGVGALDQGVRDLASDAGAMGTVVRKNGSTTGLTTGTLVELFETETDGSIVWQMRVAATTGHSYSAHWQLDPAEDPNEVKNRFTGTVSATIESSGGHNVLRVSGTVWTLPGDSGSPVVDAQRRVVGLHYGGVVTRVNITTDDGSDFADVPLGDGVEAYIVPVFHALNLDPATAVIPPGSPSSGATVEAPEMEVMRGSWAAAEHAMRELEAAAKNTPAGRRLLALLSAHYPAIAHLVHHRRRVTVVWHRNRGPAFAAAILQALRRPDAPMPTELSGVRLVDAARKFGSVLEMEGSPGLAAAVRAETDLLLHLAERATSVPELLLALREAQ